ncbi:MAG: carboxypeptidase regulatory-like domain-containing protein [Bacteroidaceae bacterium]|nr:carboxypeptidase regulatory-like domain-containing protein [Bacteroidaceae bacterium]
MKKLFSICIVLLCQMAAFAQSENTKHTITILADPEGSSTVYYSWKYVSSIEKETGEQVVLTVDPSTGYVLDTLVSAEIDTKNVSNYDNQWTISFTMPDKDVTITAHAHYAPELPANPNESGWDEGTGSIVVNHFAPGGLYDAIYNTLYNPETYNADLSKVTAITAVGTITEGDWRSILLYNYFENLTYLDLSRTVGLSELGIRYYNPGSRDNETLTTLLLPATIDSIGNYAYLDRLKALKSLTIYATTPPKLITDDLEQLPADMVLYVPAESLPLYMEADGWKDLEIQPITQGVHSLTVNLPQGTTASSFKDMFLELVNTQTARVQRYVMTSSTQYTFPNLINDTHYNIYIRNAQGDILARMEGVDVKRQNVSVTLSNVTTPQDITLQLITPDGKDVTDQATTTWTDQRGNYIATGNTLGSQMNGTQVRFSVKLPEALGILYQLPADSLITVGGNATLSVRLQPLPKVELSGTVTAEATGSPIRNANIAVTQLLNGRYSQTLTTTTDANGNWTLTVPDAPATITAAATDYVSSILAVEAFSALTESVSFALRDLTGTRLYLNIYYRPAVREGEMMDGDEAYADYQGISYTVYDETHQRALPNLKVQYPYMVLQDEELAEGTQLRVTATSSTGAFMPVTATCLVKADDSTIVTLPITQLGQLKATFSQTDNLAVVGLLYDGDGNLRGTYSYDEAQLTLTDIPDGDYTLVTMGESRLFNGINTLDGLTEMGLEAGREYVSNTVSIESGRIDSLHNQVIPSFDETIFSYTTDETLFSANKTQVTVGNYVTLRTQVAYKSSVTPRKVKMFFDLPEGCSLVEGSVMAGSSLATYSMDGNRLTVPLTNATDIVRFCVVPTKEGYYETQASVTFTSAARERIQPLGSVGITADALSISVPQRSGSGIVPVSGTAIGGSQVQIYDDEVLIGQTEASPAGYWKVQCALNNPYNLSEHTIYALITTPEGVQMQTAASTVTISHGTLKPVVTGRFYNKYHGETWNIKWDLRNATVNPTSYGWPTDDDNVPFTFLIDFMDEEDVVANDTTVISNVILYVLLKDNSVIQLNSTYSKNRWVAQHSFNHDATPMNVYVEYVQDEKLLADLQQKDDLIAEVEAHLAEGQQLAREIHALFDEPVDFEGKEMFDELKQLLAIEEPDEKTTARIDSLLVEIVGQEAIDNVVLEEQADIDELNNLLAIPVEEATLETEMRIEELVNSIMAVKQPEKSELVTLMDTLNAQREEWREQMLDMLSIMYLTDTTTLVKPDGDMEFDDDTNKHYTTCKLESVNAEELLAQGYEEYSTTDGYTIYYLRTDNQISYVDTRDAILYTVELDEETMAKARRAANNGLGGILKTFLFDEQCRTNAEDFALNFEKLVAQWALYSPDNDAFINNTVTTGMGIAKAFIPVLQCLWKSGLDNLLKGVGDAYTKFTTEIKEKAWNKVENDYQKATEDLAKATKQRSAREWTKAELTGHKMQLEAQLLYASSERAEELRGMLDINQRELNAVKDGLKETYKWVDDATNALNIAKSNKKFIEGVIKETEKIYNTVNGFLKSLPKVINGIDKMHSTTKWLAKFGGTAIGALLQVYPLCCVVQEVITDVEAWLKTYQAIRAKIPCEGNPDEALAIYVETLAKFYLYANAGFNQIKLDAGSLALDIVSLTGVTVTWYVSVIMDVVSVLHAVFRPGMSQSARKKLDARIRALDCTPKKKPQKDAMLGSYYKNLITTGDPFPPSTNSTSVYDPSGFVYEAVNSNRLEGVTATCYYKETVEDMYGDLHENIVVWDAENYAQENPLFTDSEGKYAWDVPQGLWQVKFEKEGYETTRSEWLPVPPPQLEVNVGMTQLRQPVVSRVKAYPEGIDITFDKYMRPQTLTAENIFVTKGGQTIGGKMELLNSDSGYETPDSVYASKVRFVPSTPLTANDKVQLTVRKTVESYAGIQMESDYTQQFDVELRVLSIETDSLLYLADDATQSLTVQALPVEAAKGKSLSVATMNPDVVDLSAEALTLDANGQAQVTLTATGLGTSAVKFSLTDDDLTASTLVLVADAESMMVDEPTASRMSGTEIYRGTEIKLTCQTAGATILYTLDGSCPCDADSKSVRTYTGPIVATGDNLIIRAMAVANGMGESDVVEYRYKVIDLPVVIETVTTDDGIEMRVPVAYYRLDGRRMSKLGRGINIVRHADGRVEKVLIK